MLCKILPCIMKNIGMKSMLERIRNVPGTYWERTRNVQGKQLSSGGGGTVGEKGKGEKRKEKHFMDALLVVENGPGTCCQCFRFPIEKRSQGEEN